MRPTSRNYRLAMLRIQFAREEREGWWPHALFRESRLLRVMDALR